MQRILATFLACFFFLNLSAQPPGCTSGTAVNGAAGQSGLYGEYFAGYFADNTSFFPAAVGGTVQRIESNINYPTNNWGAIVPPATGTVGNPDNYSARYRGSIYIATAGTYTFYTSSDDASYMWIDNDAIAYPAQTSAALVNNGGLHGTQTRSGSVFLTVGLHNIQLQFGEQGGGNVLIFEYECAAAGIARQVVPNSVLCTSVQPLIPPPPPPTGCTCSDFSGNAGAAGSHGQYYAGYYNDVHTFFTSNSPGLTRIDARLAYTTNGGWGSIIPPASGSAASPETYSVRWTGSIFFPVTGNYTFYMTSDDASHLWFDGPALATNPTTATAAINNGGMHGATTVTYTASFSSGLHPVRIHFGENTGNNIFYLEWESATAGITRQIVGQTSWCSCFAGVALPVELLDFKAEQVNQSSVAIQWSTASENNASHFLVQKSLNGIEWGDVGVLNAAGNSSTIRQYEIIDYQFNAQTTYYRLVQYDLNGDYEIFGPLAVNSTGSEDPFRVYVSGEGLVLSPLHSSAPNKADIRIMDISGRELYAGRLDFSNGSINLPFHYPSSIYLVELTFGNRRTIYRLGNIR